MPEDESECDREESEKSLRQHMLHDVSVSGVAIRKEADYECSSSDGHPYTKKTGK